MYNIRAKCHLDITVRGISLGYLSVPVCNDWARYCEISRFAYEFAV